MAKRAGTLDRSRDWYKVLQVPRTASIPEIKASYRKLALKLHPDRNKDDPQKTAEFKIVNQAYSILSNEDTKNTYDFEIGIRYNANRRTPPPPNYRYVHTSHAQDDMWCHVVVCAHVVCRWSPADRSNSHPNPSIGNMFGTIKR